MWHISARHVTCRASSGKTLVTCFCYASLKAVVVWEVTVMGLIVIHNTKRSRPWHKQN